jgi:hypothetical protein
MPWSYHVCGRPTPEKLHDDPQLDALDKARFVLGDVGAVAGAQQGDFGLDVDELFAALFEVDLGV